MLAVQQPPPQPALTSTALPAESIARALPDQVPENAPEHCPGTESEQAGKADACAGCPNQDACASAPKGPDPDLPLIQQRMSRIKHKILIMSGKGGVGKSTFTAQLGWAFSSRFSGHFEDEEEDIKHATNGSSAQKEEAEKQVAIMDIDICGPSIPTILGLAGQSIHSTSQGWSPVYVSDNLCAMSIGFLLPSASSAVIWRGPKKNGLIKQFLKDVDWTAGLEEEEEEQEQNKLQPDSSQSASPSPLIDYMLIDTPPGTSDEHLSIVSYLKQSGITGAILLTTPQEVSLQDVRKEISFCRKMDVPILGIVENMAGFVCPSCTGYSEIFYPSTGGAKALCEELGLTFLGSIPLDPRIGKSCDLGVSFCDEYPDSPATKAYGDVIDRIRELVD
ncbi:hypothetical protein PHSY_007352 [Pseudozyma hubeiensis SY62]|uniref:Uncharacterized protein n=1 Tax=Pseudozyma hubeiensis (strain SY62) TaxID=1305764 RepID=R9PEG5_PSEHS|nr:hypothetical protein PHSY_007352 [Pseudozyma hubeiensis SY62]GAC99749.1 hypothetical protein PHSY_007352 [Pseudozyma hubeiensis SY62]